MSRLGQIYERFYGAISGRHPYLRPWHFQYTAGGLVYHKVRPTLASVQGKVLDIGCGMAPYRSWIGKNVKGGTSSYTGLDTTAESRADVVVRETEAWPLADEEFDVVLCTQVLEHVREMDVTLNESYRVLKRGGRLIVTVPFIYNVHGAPGDFRRLSTYGARVVLEKRFAVERIEPQGGIGTTLGTLALNWIETESNRHWITAGLKVLLLPIWMLFCLCVNIAALIIDKVDTTQAFFQNVFVIAKKS